MPASKKTKLYCFYKIESDLTWLVFPPLAQHILSAFVNVRKRYWPLNPYCGGSGIQIACSSAITRAMKKILLINVLFLSIAANAQRYIWSPDSLLQNDPNYTLDRYHDILRYHDPIMYLVFPVIRPVSERSLPLEDGEGKDGYLAEGNFGYRFTIQKGKYYSARFFQKTRFTFDVGLTPRLTNDHSSPLLPSNNKFGLGLDLLFSKLDALKKERTTLVWTTVQLHHYSNGQADSFFIDHPIQRNNYTGGDFSTNYYRVLLNIAGSAQQKSITAVSLGYQKDIDLGGPLTRSKELTDYYGDDRLLFSFQWTQKPALRTVSYLDRSTPEEDVIEIEKRRQWGFRTEVEYILGGLSKFTGENKRRFGWHTYLTFMPSVSNEVGFLLHSFVGRDYLNIRFDDIVFIGGAGVYVRFNSR